MNRKNWSADGPDQLSDYLDERDRLADEAEQAKQKAEREVQISAAKKAGEEVVELVFNGKQHAFINFDEYRKWRQSVEGKEALGIKD
ncbi:MAG: hypothetical protein IT366_10875 [Candidatus Hydrogenedentes bacterium]|nr:hypothetical protein [Candidatus Hydrogenedentota bacterium]